MPHIISIECLAWWVIFRITKHYVPPSKHSTLGGGPYGSLSITCLLKLAMHSYSFFHPRFIDWHYVPHIISIECLARWVIFRITKHYVPPSKHSTLGGGPYGSLSITCLLKLAVHTHTCTLGSLHGIICLLSSSLTHKLKNSSESDLNSGSGLKIIPGSSSVKSISGSDALLYRNQEELFDEKVSAKNLMVPTGP